jgi:glucokinase
MKVGIGIDLGGTRIKSARFDLDTGALLGTAMVPTRDGECEVSETSTARVVHSLTPPSPTLMGEGDSAGRHGIPAFAAGVKELVARHEQEVGHAAELVGVSAPGLAARDGSCIRFMPGKLLGLEGLLLADLLGRPVKCLNDAHAALMGEVWQGAAQGKRDVVMLTLGTGVGGAVLADGRLLQGHIGRAGHLGHISVDMHGPRDICGTPGSIEYHMGNGYLDVRSGGRFQMTRDLLSAAQVGDPVAQKVWERSLQALAVTVVGLINAFDPELVVIGGGIANAWGEVSTRLEAKLEEYEWRPGGHSVPVVRAELGEWAGCYGAVRFCQNDK